MNIVGTIYQIGDVENVTDTFRKRNFIVAEDKGGSPYVEYIQFQLEQRDVFRINSFHVGDEVAVEYEIKGKKWNRKDGTEGNFTYLKAISIDPVVRVPKPKSDGKVSATVSDVSLLEEGAKDIDTNDDLGSARHPKYPVTTSDDMVGDLPWEKKA